MNILEHSSKQNFLCDHECKYKYSYYLIASSKIFLHKFQGNCCHTECKIKKFSKYLFLCIHDLHSLISSPIMSKVMKECQLWNVEFSSKSSSFINNFLAMQNLISSAGSPQFNSYNWSPASLKCFFKSMGW